jgi:signal transduction histidine kinase
MTFSLYTRLIGAFLLIAVVAVALVSLFIRQANISDLRRVVLERERQTLARELADHYATERSWTNVRQGVDRVLGVRAGPREGGAPTGSSEGPPAVGGPPRSLGLPAVADADGVVVLPLSDFQLGTTVSPAVLAVDGTAIVVDGQRVGWVLLLPARDQPGAEEQIYVERTNRALLLGSAGAVVVAFALGLFLARRMTAPLQALTVAASRIAHGDLEQQVVVRSRDEIGQLGLAFNQMSQEIALQTQLRRQMTADVAHDLRTPLTTIAGYVEAFEEGALQPTPERLRLLSTEVTNLQQLVSDLRMLSQADAGELRLNLQPMPPAALVERAASAHRRRAEQSGIELHVAASTNGAHVNVDEARMARVFDNLVDNAVQHTPAGGRIVLAADAEGDSIVFRVRDSGKGIPAEDVAHVFDRFYRADKARGSDGHSGLGLAIVRALVEAHGGSVRAASQLGQGTEMVAVLPAVHAT